MVPAGEAAPVQPHLSCHVRMRQIVRSTRNLPLAQRQAGWSICTGDTRRDEKHASSCSK